MIKIGIIISQFNQSITEGLLKGALDILTHQNEFEKIETEIFWVPGAFEIPLIAKKLAQTQIYESIICLGCVIQGETAHFEYISSAATFGIMQTMLETQIPIHFGMLTAFTVEQAIQRSQANDQNKGAEAAQACLKTLATLVKIKIIHQSIENH